jgi:BirA family transcriptional regulator, biotin operon repressor / biotin---[acetyl-CoA-carboxylase] ligase
MQPNDEWHLDTQYVGKRTLVFDQIDSTSTCAARLAQDPADSGIAVLAHGQTAGRGQHGRTWQCPTGAGVLLSVALFPPAALLRPALLTAWAAVAVCETIAALADLQGRIKWPNDILVGGKKIAGILIERGRTTVTGIGLNLNQSEADFRQGGLPEAVSLAMVSGRSFSWEAAARLLLTKLDEGYARLLNGNLEPLAQSWRSHLGFVGQKVELECISGERRRARLLQCDFDGIILVDDTGRHSNISAESVRHVHATQ